MARYNKSRPYRNNDKATINVYVETEYVLELDLIVAEKGFKSRNQLIREAIIDTIDHYHPTLKGILDQIAAM
jgi:Predicted transcriptional regulators containing the CopG/Arc/MetJ DNA-binding domain and a metal-binding domain